MKKTLLLLLLILPSPLLFSQATITVTTWNIEHLGSSGRGLGGIGAGNLGKRTSAQMEQIARLIEDTLQTDLIAIQEVALTHFEGDSKRNVRLDTLLMHMSGDWQYVIGASGHEEQVGDQVDNMQNAFLWNASRVSLIKHFDMDLPNIVIGENAFDRQPLVGYFEAFSSVDSNLTDFVLVNVHLKSGQDNDENHLATMVIIEQNLSDYLKENEIKESDRAILGDFNDNPYDPRYTDFLYTYMQYKKYLDLTTEGLGATRMDNALTSIIDHILVNNSIRNEMDDVVAEKYFPSADSTALAAWRQTFSDHFPISFKIRISSDGDVDW